MSEDWSISLYLGDNTIWCCFGSAADHWFKEAKERLPSLNAVIYGNIIYAHWWAFGLLLWDQFYMQLIQTFDCHPLLVNYYFISQIYLCHPSVQFSSSALFYLGFWISWCVLQSNLQYGSSWSLGERDGRTRDRCSHRHISYHDGWLYNDWQWR